MNTFFTSDTHYGHANIIKYCGRPFSSTEEMDETMIERWNSVVKPTDRVFHLGDFAMGSDLKLRVSNIRRRLNGRITLIIGNHDRNVNFYIRCGFDEVGKQDWLNYNDLSIFMNHRPRPELRDNYDILLCGHVHETWKKRDNIINVGVDQWNFTPISIDTLVSMNGFGGCF